MKPNGPSELAELLRANCRKTDYPIANREEAEQIATLLDELAALKRPIEGAEEIEKRHDFITTYVRICEPLYKDAHQDRSTLLAALRQARAREEAVRKRMNDIQPFAFKDRLVYLSDVLAALGEK